METFKFQGLQLFAVPTDGVNFLVAVNTGTDDVPFYTNIGGQRGATFKLQADEIDASSKTSGGWKTTIPGLRSWGIDFDALILAGDVGYQKLLQLFLARTPVQVKYTRADGSVWKGPATISDLSEESPHDDSATYKGTLSGIGEPTLLVGVQQVESVTVVGKITTAGNAKVTITGSGITGSPKDISVAVALNDSAAVVAQKIREALAADAAITALYSVGGYVADVVFTRKIAAVNDDTLNIAITNDTCAGLTPVAYSKDTTAGAAAP